MKSLTFSGFPESESKIVIARLDPLGKFLATCSGIKTPEN